jgi:hypothetical protein
MSANLDPGGDYTIFAETGYDGNYVCVWIDFNDNGEFEAAELLVEDFELEFGAQIYAIPISIPPDVMAGEHRLRAKGVWEESASDPCADFTDGETEDYTINITGELYANDVGIVSIDIEANLPPGPVEVKITLKNFGYETQTVIPSIINGVDYGTSAIVNDLLPGEVRQINFAIWNAEIGTYTFFSYLAEWDDNPSNDQFSKEIVVEQPDVPVPQNLTAEIISNSVLLNWEAPETKDLVGYNVYNNGIRVASNLTEQSYTDLCLTKGDYNYTVTAVYTVGESLPCNPVEIAVEYCDLLILPEDFENYTAGQQLVLQAQQMGIDYWQCWSQPAGSDEDPYISDEMVFEGDNAMLIEGLNDVTMDLGAKTIGKYAVSFKLYVPSGFDGFFGIWREVSSASGGTEAYFNEDETGFAIIANSDWQAFTFDADTWNNVQLIIDLDNDWAKLYLNDLMMCQAQWSLDANGDSGPLKLDVIDFYAGVMWGGTPKSFVDDIEIKQIIEEKLPPENLEAQVDGNDILLSWEAPMDGLITYLVYENGNLLAGTSDLSVNFEDMEIGEYEFEVSALYGECESMHAGPVVATVHPTQTINIPEGWSGLSSCIDPLNPDIESIFQPILNELVILQSENGMYWPGENLNTLIDWDFHTGYKIKVTEGVSLTFSGQWGTNKTIQLDEGWNLIPVLSECDVNVEVLFDGLDVVLIKEIAGDCVFWPQYGINSLGFLQSGKAYFVLLESAGEIMYPECALKSSTVGTLTGFQTLSGLNLKKTPISHTIAIPTGLIDEAIVGNFLCAFNQNGDCFGFAFLSGNGDALTLYGDDPTTPGPDGILEGEPIYFKIVNSSIEETIDVEISFDPDLPHSNGLFVIDGISAIQSLKTVAAGMGDKSEFLVNFYPNPASDFVYVDLPISGKLELLDMHGKLFLSNELVQGTSQINVSNLEPGIYFIRISSGNTIITELLIIR